MFWKIKIEEKEKGETPLEGQPNLPLGPHTSSLPGRLTCGPHLAALVPLLSP